MHEENHSDAPLESAVLCECACDHKRKINIRAGAVQCSVSDCSKLICEECVVLTSDQQFSCHQHKVLA